VHAIFETLRQQVKDDVDERRGQLQGPPFDYDFKFVQTQRSFAAVVEGSQIHDSVVFALNGMEISVKDANGNPMFTAVPTISDDGECRVKVNGEERELWQFRKAALEEIFFSPR
jgi:hypothetical protein